MKWKRNKRLAGAILVLFGAFLLAVVFYRPSSAGENYARQRYLEDYNGEARTSVEDVLALMLLPRHDPEDPWIDYNADGGYSLGDAIGLLLNIMRSNLTLVVEPVEIDSFLLNPGRGFISTHCFNDWIIRGVPRHPVCSVAQFRWYWDELEPEEGRINFALIDSMIEKARRNDQKLMFRVMCQDGKPHVPQWVRDAGAKGKAYSGDPDNWQPYYSDSIFLEKHENLIKALGERYDGHPDIDHVDIGSVGRWGEWHTSGTGMKLPPHSVLKKYVDMYLDNLKNTPLIMQIGGGTLLTYAVANGAGWRADCLGDMGGFSSTWNHMEDFYQQALDEAGVNDAWKKAPVVFETCWTMDYWYKMGWDIDYILSEALRWHVSLLNNGSESIPALCSGGFCIRRRWRPGTA